MKNLLILRTGHMRSPARRSGGFTLIELMISVTMGLIIVAGLAGVLASTASSSKTNDRTSELQSNGRYALSSIKNELLQAGYRGYTWAEPNTPVVVGAVTGECGNGTGNFVTNIRQGVWGANDSNPFSANCISSTDKPSSGGVAGAAGGDILVVRRVDGTPVDDATAAANTNTLYFRSTFNAGEVFKGTSTVAALVPIANFKLLNYVYYVRP
ncbi:MAG: prepilin-type N-terminal cleavage/methylation domain-containing protein, partial [Ramlibacter sp.]